MIAVALLAMLALGAPEPAPDPDLTALFHDACLWEVGSNAEKVKAARLGLIAAGERALAYLVPEKLDTKDTLVTRALTVVVTGIGRSAVPHLLPALESDRSNVRRNAADLLGALGATEVAPAIARLLADPDARLGALSALAALKAEAAVPEVVAVVESDAPERVRTAGVVTLGAIGGVRAKTALARQLCQAGAPVRFAAEAALVAAKDVALLRALLADPEPVVRLHAIAALGRIGDRAARPDLLGLLDDDSAVVRGFAVEALRPMLDPALRTLFAERLAVEPAPFVNGKLRETLEP